MFIGKKNDKREPFTGNKQWKPPTSKCHQAITALGNMLDDDITKLVKRNNIRSNFSIKDREALRSLRNNKNIIVKKADKGGCIVVLDTNNYVEKINEMLSDSKTYTSIADINLDNSKLEVNTIIDKLLLKELITKRQKKFLSSGTPKMPIFYGLPKIHKTGNPLRPIVSQIDSPSYKLNKLLDYILTTAEKEIPYLLQDTTKFLQYIDKLQLSSDLKPILFTIDVTSLYTVLPHDMCIKYVIEMYSETLDKWNTHSPDIKPIDTDSLADIISTVLNQTFFQFNEKCYML